MDKVCAAYVATHLYLVFWAYKNNQRKKIKSKNKTDADTMCGKILLTVNNKACIPHCKKLPKLTTITVVRVKDMPQHRVFGKLCMIRG